MANAWRFGCGRSKPPIGDGQQVELNVRAHDGSAPGGTGNVRLGIETVRESLLAECPAPLLDLLEIAAYVYAADQAASRGLPSDLGACWRRTMSFRIPVRDPKRWNSSALLSPLVETLEFLSEDDYQFEFVQRRPDSPPKYFTFGGQRFDRAVDSVMLFSGGMDSTAGAVEEAIVQRRHVVLVQHRSNPKMQARHDALIEELMRRAKEAGGEISHFPVVVNKYESLTEDTTQRARSFLFAALAAAVGAMMAGPDCIQFYENGVVGLNLPLTPAAVGARATRTAHPRTLAGFARILSAVTGRTFRVENPFLWDTRTDVVRRLVVANAANLLSQSISCGATRFMTNKHPHCGMCSQCIGRRFAILAAGQEANDPADQYKIDVLIGDRSDGDPRLVLAAFLDAAERVERARGPADLLALFGEAARALRPAGRSGTLTTYSPKEVAERVFKLYKCHAEDVNRVLDEAGKKYIMDLRRRTLPEGCTLRLVHDNGATIVVASPAAVSAKPPSKRPSRADKIRKLTEAMIEHLGRACDDAKATLAIGGTPKLLDRPTKKWLAKYTGMSAPDVARCFKDKTARELRIYWEMATDVYQVIKFSGPVGSDPAA